MEKSVVVAYLAWLLGGVVGLHHFYLGRDRHAFTWWCTLGGFGFGWFRDLWRLPEYVDDANDVTEYLEDLRRLAQRQRVPPFSIVRLLGEVILGLCFGFLVLTVVPEDWYLHTRFYFMYYVILAATPFGIGLGVHTVANIGREGVAFKGCLRGAYMCLPLILLGSNNLTYSAISCALYANNNCKTWKTSRHKRRRNVCARLLVLSTCCLLYSAMWTVAVTKNAYITTKDGNQVLLRTAIWNFFSSPAWAETKQSMGVILEELMTQGFWKAWDEFKIQIDPEGETNAYRVLGINSGADDSEISSAYRKMVRQYHPDKVRDPALKEKAEEKFMQIQQAYETLSNIKSRRAQKNKRHQSHETVKTEL